MASREISVVINGKEYVSKAADEAGEGMNRFTGGIKGWFRSFVDLKAAWDLASGAARQLYDQVVDSFRALDEYRSAIARLDAAAKITGVSITDLEAQVQQAKTTFQLGSTSAVDLTVATNKFAKAAGDTSLAGRLMAAALDLGAAQGLKATQMAEGLTSALAGNDEFLNKLGLANPSQLWKDYAQAVGLSASKLTEQQQKFAVLNAIMEAGNKVTGTYSSYLETSAGKQELLNNTLEEARVSFGRALDPLRLMSLELGQKLLPVLNVLAPFIAKVVILTFTALGKVLTNVVGLTGLLVTGFGQLSRSNTLVEWGARTALSAQNFGQALNELSEAAKSLGKSTDQAADKQRAIDAAFAATQQMAKAYGTEVKGANDKVTTSSKTAADQVTGDSARIAELLNRNLGPSLKDSIKLTEGALRDLGESARTQLDPGQAERFARHMQTLVAAAGDARTRIEALPAPMEAGSKSSRDMALRVADVARAGLDAAKAFGVINDEAVATLATVINLGVSVAKVVGGDQSGWAGIITSTASLLTRMMGGDTERRRLIQANTDQLARLTEKVGDLSLDVTGEDFAKIQRALSSVLPQLAGGRGAANQADIFNALRRVGLSWNDVKKLSDQLGIQVTTSSGAISVEGIRSLLEAMGMVELGQFGSSYAEQLRATRAGFEVSGAGGRAQLQAMLDLTRRFTAGSLNAIAGAGLTDLAGTRLQLQQLFERFQAGGFTAAELGGLTGEQFLDLTLDLIRRIDDLMGAAGGAEAGAIPAGISPAVAATQTVQAAVTAQTDAVTSVLTAHGALHTRVALATERTAIAAEAILVEIRRGMAANTVAETVDQSLETTRRALAAQRGVQLSLG